VNSIRFPQPANVQMILPNSCQDSSVLDDGGMPFASEGDLLEAEDDGTGFSRVVGLLTVFSIRLTEGIQERPVDLGELPVVLTQQIAA
jgi:hypothetical protein